MDKIPRLVDNIDMLERTDKTSENGKSGALVESCIASPRRHGHAFDVRAAATGADVA